MKRIVASLLALTTAATLAATPALAESRKTELIDLDGKNVDVIQLRYDMDAGWVIDNRTLLYRDTSREHFLVTLKEACKQIDNRGRSFKFFPSWSWRLLASNTYEVRPEVGQECDVARIEKIDETKANALRDSAMRRIW
jgi:hypothetical protein